METPEMTPEVLAMAQVLLMSREDKEAAKEAEATTVAEYMAADERTALEAAVREATEALAAYDEAAPATPITDAIAAITSQFAPVSPSRGSSRGSDMDESHARTWLESHKDLAKWPAIQQYRATGATANSERFFALHAEVKAA